MTPQKTIERLAKEVQELNDRSSRNKLSRIEQKLYLDTLKNACILGIIDKLNIEYVHPRTGTLVKQTQYYVSRLSRQLIKEKNVLVHLRPAVKCRIKS